MIKYTKLIGGILLVSGTTIGAGMLALPISTGAAGFIPTVCLFLFYWAYMTYTALLLLEVNLWMSSGTNLISMARRTLGRWGEGLSWVTYLFLLYSLTTAYIAGSGPIVVNFIASLTGYQFPAWAGAAPLLLIFGLFIYRGTRSVDYLNRVLMMGLVVTYSAIVLFLSPHVEVAKLSYIAWKPLLLGVSIVSTSFGFHIIIPTLTTYFHRDVGSMKKAILIGSVIPLIVYIVWELLTLGIIPLEGPVGIYEAHVKGGDGAQLLTHHISEGMISTVLRCFAFFAIVTSFIGVSMSLFDFLADGLKIKKTPLGKALLYGLTFGPPMAMTLTNPRAFLTALEYAGAFGVVILLGLLPALMVWWGRYRCHLQSVYSPPGGKPALILVMGISCLVILLEIAIKLGFIQ
jgi:tyrosine-specific transport protein